MIDGLFSLAQVARRRWLAVLVWTLSGTAAAGVLNLLLPVTYEATAELFVTAPEWNDSTAIVDPNYGTDEALAYGDEFTQQRMITYSRLVTTSIVTDPVAEQLDLRMSGDELARKLSTHVVPDTVIIEIHAVDASPRRAADIATVVAEQTSKAIKAMEKPSYGVVSPVQPVAMPAMAPRQPISPRPLLTAICGALTGLLLGLTFAAIGEMRRVSAMSRGFSSEPSCSALTVAGSSDESVTATAEDIDQLCTALIDRSDRADLGTLAMTSPRSAAAAWDAALALASSLAERGVRTVMVNGDFGTQRFPDVEDQSDVGLGELLVRRFTLDSALQTDRRAGFTFIAAGSAPPNPTTALTGERMSKVLRDLESRFRFVLVVTPPILESTEGLELASMCDTSILVCPNENSAGNDIRDCEGLLEATTTTYLGRFLFPAPRISRRSFSMRQKATT